MKECISKRMVAFTILFVMLIQLPFSNVSANSASFNGKSENQETVYYDGIAFNVTYFDGYSLVTADQDSVKLEMKYYEDDTATVILENESNIEEEYQLEIVKDEENVNIDVYQEGDLIVTVDDSYDNYEGQAAIAAALAGMTLADWLFSAAVTVVVSKTVYDACAKSSIDIKPSKNHKVTKKNPGPNGDKNSSVDIVSSDKKLLTRRWFNKNGRATRDVDFTNHGNPKAHPKVPHEHFWDWSSGSPIRN